MSADRAEHGIDATAALLGPAGAWSRFTPSSGLPAPSTHAVRTAVEASIAVGG